MRPEEGFIELLDGLNGTGPRISWSCSFLVAVSNINNPQLSANAPPHRLRKFLLYPSQVFKVAW